MQYGYGRVSRVKQDTALQRDAFAREGVTLLVTEKWSSVGQRPKLMALLASLQPGDVLVVWKLDRVGRSLRDLLHILDRIDAAGAAFRSLTQPFDTTTPIGLLMYQLLGAFAQFEHGLIRERSIAGQRAAVARGARCGRPRSSTPEVDRWALRLWASGWYTIRTIAIVLELHESTVKRILYRVHRPMSSSLR